MYARLCKLGDRPSRPRVIAFANRPSETRMKYLLVCPIRWSLLKTLLRKEYKSSLRYIYLEDEKELNRAIIRFYALDNHIQWEFLARRHRD